MEPFYYTKMTKQQQAAYHVIMQGANALADEFQIPRIDINTSITRIHRI